MVMSLRVLPQRIALTLLAGIMVVGIAGAADQAPFWPQFHGPNQDNLSTEKGLLQEWPEDGPNLLWTAEGLGHGFSTVSLAGGRIYTAGNIDGNTVVSALDLDGKMLWQAKNGKAWTEASVHPGTRGTPTVDGDRVYHESPLGNVICLDAKTGETVWQLNILEEFRGKNIRWGLSESLLVDGDYVICSPGGTEGSMVALDKNTGDVVWTTPGTDEGPGYSSPILVEYGGLRMVIALTSRALIGVDAGTGKRLWHVPHVSYTDQNNLNPVFHDGSVFVSTLQGASAKWKLVVKEGEVSVEEEWRSQDFDNHHGGVVLVNGNLYGTSSSKNRNLWVCLDWETGRIKHTDKGVGKGSLMYADGMLYALGEDGIMGLVRPTPDGHEWVSSFQIPEGGEGNSWAHPVVCGGRLYIRHGAFLYAYNVRR